MKHQECSDCKHKIFTYEGRSKHKDTWTAWNGIILAKDHSVRIAFDRSKLLQIINHVHESGSEYEYRRTP